MTGISRNVNRIHIIKIYIEAYNCIPVHACLYIDTCTRYMYIDRCEYIHVHTYMCIHTGAYIHVHTCTHICMHTHARAHARTHARPHACTHAHPPARTRTHARTHARMHARTHAPIQKQWERSILTPMNNYLNSKYGSMTYSGRNSCLPIDDRCMHRTVTQRLRCCPVTEHLFSFHTIQIPRRRRKSATNCAC